MNTHESLSFIECPDCNIMNQVSHGDPYNSPYYEVEGFKCRVCLVNWKFNEEDPELFLHGEKDAGYDKATIPYYDHIRYLQNELADYCETEENQ